MIPCIDNYRDLPLGVYEQIVAIKTDDPLDTQVAVLSLLTGLSERELLNLPIGDYAALAGKAQFLTRQPEALPRVADCYKVGGFELIPASDLRKVTAAQYIDFQAYAPDAEHKLVEILSCFCVPRGMKYNDGYDILDVHAAIRELSVADALALSAFFLRRYVALIRATRTSLEKMARRERNPQRRAEMEERMERIRAAGLLLTGGDGWPA